MFLEQPEVSELLVLEAMVSDQGAPQQSSGGAASCSVLPAVDDGRLHGLPFYQFRSLWQHKVFLTALLKLTLTRGSHRVPAPWVKCCRPRRRITKDSQDPHTSI